jgi:hypothetical protein
MAINKFLTNCGALFLFEIDKYTIVYATTDFNKIVENVFHYGDTNSELYIGRVIVLKDKKYKIVNISTYANWDLGCGFEDQLDGELSKYSIVVRLTVQLV